MQLSDQLEGTLNGQGHYLSWWVFNVSVANLVVILVMVALFGGALLIRFPGHDHLHEPGPDDQPGGGDATPASRSDLGDPEDAAMWTARVRRAVLGVLPPGKLLPDRQPAYVASWIYVFGVATIAALALVIASGCALALGGPDWWHTDPVGHFFNSIHLWSVELFMAFMVIHLWGKFWMAAWRGRRALTWITGVVAFAASVLECFTGYLSQQNYDSQWIATNGKDAINTTGLGGFFNLMNFGQMFMWHIVLIPIALIPLIGGHVLMVRMRGVSQPLPQHRPASRSARRAARKADAAEWRGPTRRYDIVKEATLATLICFALVLGLAGFLSSPDEPSLTIATWAKLAPADFVATAAAELSDQSLSAQYGPPYNDNSGSVQRLGVSWQSLVGVHIKIDPAQDFVLQPLAKAAPSSAPLAAALAEWNAASATEQNAWAQAYDTAAAKITMQGSQPVVPGAGFGPVPTLMTSELTLARSGALDASLVGDQQFYGTNYTKPLLFIADGQYYNNVAQDQNLTGDQWGVMNETGNYPGQPWLWLYQLWYHVGGIKNSANIDLIAIYLTGAATVLLLGVPFVPGLRDIPELIPVHRLVWRSWYRQDGVAPGNRRDGGVIDISAGGTSPADAGDRPPSPTSA